ncbi:hypothetical protein C8J56DRAFT_902094 [Mycena floridula]|nr:hypothetical protein C8J56DRAFT_902094 [Mycena floridula]
MPSNPFMLFRADVSQTFPAGTPQNMISQVAGEMWREIDPNVKATYEEQARPKSSRNHDSISRPARSSPMRHCATDQSTRPLFDSESEESDSESTTTPQLVYRPRLPFDMTGLSRSPQPVYREQHDLRTFNPSQFWGMAAEHRRISTRESSPAQQLRRSQTPVQHNYGTDNHYHRGQSAASNPSSSKRTPGFDPDDYINYSARH